MPSKLKAFIQRWIINTLAVLVATQVISWGIHYRELLDLAIAALLLGLLNAFVRPFLMLISLPLLILTLGLFTLVINAILLYWVAALLPGFWIDTFGAALGGAVVMSVVSLALNLLAGPRSRTARAHFQVNSSPDPRPERKNDGPVIDV